MDQDHSCNNSQGPWITEITKYSGFSFKGGGRTFRPVVYHFISGTLMLYICRFVGFSFPFLDLGISGSHGLKKHRTSSSNRSFKLTRGHINLFCLLNGIMLSICWHFIHAISFNYFSFFLQTQECKQHFWEFHLEQFIRDPGLLDGLLPGHL